MTKWKRYQLSKKGVAVDFDDKVADPKGKQNVVEVFKRLVKERLSLPLVEENSVGDDEMDLDFMDSEHDFDVIAMLFPFFL